MCSLPVIDFARCGLNVKGDLASKELEEVGRLLVEALSGVGFACLENVGMKKELIQRMYEVYRQFFEATLKEKLKYKITPRQHGYVGHGVENLNAETLDRKEAFNVAGPIFAGEDGYMWPDEVSPNFSSTVTEYMAQCKVLALRILEALAVGLDLDDSLYFVKSHSDIHDRGNMTQLRGSYYAPFPGSKAGQLRLGEHSDYGTLTILLQDEVGGLQVRSPTGAFIDATPMDDSVVINTGDVLQFWTNYKLKSTAHRVICPMEEHKRNQTRQSFAYFVNANNDVIIDGGLPYKDGCKVRLEESQNLPSMTVKKYVAQKMSETIKY